MTFEHGGQSSEKIFKGTYVKKHKDFKMLNVFKINIWSFSMTRS